MCNKYVYKFICKNVKNYMQNICKIICKNVKIICKNICKIICKNVKNYMQKLYAKM